MHDIGAWGGWDEAGIRLMWLRAGVRDALPVLAEIIIQELLDTIPGLEGAHTTAGEVVDLLEAQCYGVKRHASATIVVVVFIQFLLGAVGLVLAQVQGILVHVLVEIDVRICLEGAWVTKLVHMSLNLAAELGTERDYCRLGPNFKENAGSLKFEFLEHARSSEDAV